MTKIREELKILIITILVFGIFFLCIYFFRIAQNGAIFTHLLYIPIMLACAWWKRKGFYVAVFIVVLMYLFRSIFAGDPTLLKFNDNFRSVMFLLIGFLAATLNEKKAKVEEELRRSHKNLERLVEERTSDLVNTNAQLQQEVLERERAEKALKKSYEELRSSEQLKTNIISNVSHELRTPMSIALTSIELAAEEKDLQKRKKLLDKGKKALYRQEKTVDNLLKIASIQKKLDIERVDLGSVVRSISEKVRPIAEDKGIEIEIETPEIYVMADHKEIKNALVNLLDNAVKFTDTGGSIKVSVENKGSRLAKVIVEDTGIGIPKKYHKKIFDKLFQVDSRTTRRFGGIGMGLSVAKEIIEGHGGIIRFEENPAGGSIFSLILPVEAN